jgi:SagB-type dehydrogenase family enzyme
MKRIFVIIVFAAILFANLRGVFSMEKRISLPEPETQTGISLEEAIKNRRSIRSFEDRELSLEQVSQLLWAAGGITDERRGFRAAPSAGALYPMEIYIAKSDGLYHYLPASHEIEKLSDEDLRADLTQAALGQRFIAEAPVSIVICTVYRRVTGRYSERGIRYVHIEAGHIAQNVHLQAVSLGLGSVPVGAFIDSRVQRTLDIPSEHEPLYIIPVGYPKK